MKDRRSSRRLIDCTIGFAANDEGQGLAYAAVRSDHGDLTERVAFTLRPAPALLGRDIAYVALEAVAAKLAERGLERVRLLIEEQPLLGDFQERRALPASLSLPYIALRCRLNTFREATLGLGEPAVVRDLTARARAEISLLVAA